MMDEKTLVTILKQEESDASSYHDSELAKAQEEGLNRYFGRPYGDEIKGRSQVVSHDVEDTVNWIMPDLMRCFTASEDLVSIKAMAPEDDQQYVGAPEGKSKADIMAAYLAHIYFEDNRGAENTHDFLFDGLLQRIGVQKISWEDPEPGPPMMIEGVGEAQLMRYLEDPEYEILGFDDEEGPNGLSFVLEVRRTPKMGRVHIEAVPPEEFAVHKAARTLSDAKYHRRKRLAYISELARRYPDKKEELLARRSGSDNMAYDGRYSARYPDDNVVAGGTSDYASNEQRRECYLIEEYIRIDFDDDGIVELRHIKRVDDIILENIAVVCSDYKCWTPSRISHRVVGRSVFDMLRDITKIRTVITRSYLDGLSQTLSPRTYYNKNSVKQNGIDALIDNETGGLVECEGDPNSAIFESVPPDITGPALNGLAYFDERGAEATGVTKQAQGMDPQAMNKTATGIDLLQAAAKVRIEMFARWAGVALEDVFKHILRLVAAHQDGPRMVKLFGKWVEIDPRTWSDEMAVKVDIGSAGVSKQQRISNLMLVAAKQEALLAGGPTPLVGIQHLRNTYTSLVSDMGFPDPSIYFGDVPPDWQPPQQADPRVAEAEAKMALETQKAQHGAQLAEAKQQMDAQATAQKIASERELAMIKAQSEREIAQIRIAAETQLARERMVQERELARERMIMEAQLADRDSERRSKAAVASSAMKSNGSEPSLGGSRPGGSLAQ